MPIQSFQSAATQAFTESNLEARNTASRREVSRLFFIGIIKSACGTYLGRRGSGLNCSDTPGTGALWSEDIEQWRAVRRLYSLQSPRMEYLIGLAHLESFVKVEPPFKFFHTYLRIHPTSGEAPDANYITIRLFPHHEHAPGANRAALIDLIHDVADKWQPQNDPNLDQFIFVFLGAPLQFDQAIAKNWANAQAHLSGQEVEGLPGHTRSDGLVDVRSAGARWLQVMNNLALEFV